MNQERKRPARSRISEILRLERLERETRKYLYVGFVIAVLIQIALSPLITYRKKTIPKEVYRTIKLFDIPPKPFEEPLSRPSGPVSLDRRYQYNIKNAEKLFRFKKPHHDFRSIEEENYRGFLSKLEHELDIEAGRLVERDMLPDSLAVAERFIPEGFGYDTKISREPERGFSLREEMLTLDDIDHMGKYKGFVIQDPDDKQNIKGFVHIPKYILDINSRYNLEDAVEGLSEVFNFYTGISVKIDDPICLGSKELAGYPLVYITTDTTRAFELSSFMTENFGEYLRNGGFAVIDNGSPWKEYTPAEATLINLLCASLGGDFQMEPIPHDHPIYHCFFDFKTLPEGAENMTSPDEEPVGDPWGGMLHNPVLEKVRKTVSDDPNDLWGVWLGERLVAVYSDKGYGHLWKDGVTLSKHRDFSSSDGSKYNFNPQFKLGVNLMVYALIQRGGKAKQYIYYHAQYPNAENKKPLAFGVK